MGALTGADSARIFANVLHATETIEVRGVSRTLDRARAIARRPGQIVEVVVALPRPRCTRSCAVY